MTKRPKTEWMGAAECARHTGLTVRALRVYERQGLIVPSRSAKGWRRYGPKELTRLHSIVTLKAMGLSLAQIREVLTGKAPSLARVLEMQRQVWLTRKTGAEKSLSLVDAALAHLRSKRSLTASELCEIIRNVGLNDNWQAAARALTSEMLEPEERYAWYAWMAARPREELEASRQSFEEARAIMRELQMLIDAGAKPQDQTVQELLERINRRHLHGRFRERTLEQLRWNPAIARKLFHMGNKLLVETDLTGGNRERDDVRVFLGAAVAASPWGQALNAVGHDAIAEMTRSHASSAAAAALVKRLARICRAHGLGDPAIYARWVACFGPQRENESTELFERRQSAWNFLAKAAEEAAGKRARRKLAA